jgi:hypothetical protein
MTAGGGCEIWIREAAQRLQTLASGQLMNPHSGHLTFVILDL